MSFLLVPALALALFFAVLWRRGRLSERRMEEQLALFRDCFHHSNEAIVLDRLEGGRIVAVNRRFSELYGYLPEEAPTLTIEQLSLGESPYSKTEALAWRDRVRTDGPQLFEWRAKRKDGSTFWVEVSLRISPIDGAEHFVAAIRDISARKATETRAQAIEDRLGQVVSNPPVPVFAIDAEHRVTHWNRAWEIITGYPADKMIGTREPWRAFYAEPRPVMADVVLEGFRDNQLDQYYAGKYQPSRFIPRCFEAEDYFPHMGTSGVWLAFTAAPLLDGAGNAIGAIETLIDITHRKHAENGLRSSEGRYRALIENAPEAVVVYETENGTVVEANPQAEALFGREPGSLIGTDFEASIGRLTPAGLLADAATKWQGAIRQAAAGVSSRFEWAYRMADGTTGVCDVHLIKLPDEYGNVFLRCSLADITARTRAEAALTEEKYFLNSLLEAIAVPVFYKDRQGRYTGCNEAFLASLGKRRDEIIGKSVFDLAPATIAQRYFEMDEALFAQPGRQIYEWVTRKPDGEIRTVVFNKATFTGRDGHLAGLIGVILDVTELKEAHAKLEELNRDLECRVDERTRDLRAAMDQLVQSEKLAALGHLVAGVAHELNTPIGIVVTLSSSLTERLQELAERLFSGQIKRSEASALIASITAATGTLTSSALRAGELVSSFKQVAVDQASTRRRCFNLAQTVSEVLRTLQPLIKNPDKVLITADIPELNELDSFPGPFEQVLTNLVMNCVIHGFDGRNGGIITISAQDQGGSVLFIVNDDGVGIPAAEIRHIFEPFFTTKLGKGGSGLGLYLVHTIVAGQLGGTIQVDSDSGRGTRIEVRLPRRAPDPSDAPRRKRGETAPGQSEDFVI